MLPYFPSSFTLLLPLAFLIWLGLHIIVMIISIDLAQKALAIDELKKVSIYLPQQKKGTIKEYKKLLYKKQYTHLKVLQLRYSGRDSIIQVRIDLIFIMVPLNYHSLKLLSLLFKILLGASSQTDSVIAATLWTPGFCLAVGDCCGIWEPGLNNLVE